MKVTCEQCTVGHEVEPPPWLVASGKPFDFRCPACGHRQKVRPTVGIGLVPGMVGELDAGTVVEEAVRPRPQAARRPSAPPTAMLDDDPFAGGPEASYLLALDEGEPTVIEPAGWRGDLIRADADGITLRQGGDEFAVPDLATLQRWIMERRVEPDDALSDGETGWTRAGDRPDLAVFFAAVQQLESMERRDHHDLPRARSGSVDGTDAVPVAPPDEDEEGDPTVESPATPTEEVPLPRPTPLEIIQPSMMPAPASRDDDDAPTELAPTIVERPRPAPLPPPVAAPHPTSTAWSGLGGLAFGFSVAVVVATIVWAAVLRPPEPVAPVVLPMPRVTAAPEPAIQPKSLQALVAEAEDALAHDNPAGAVDLARAALIRDDADARSHMVLGLALHRLGRYAESSTHLCQARDRLGAAEQTRVRELLEEQRQTCPGTP